MQPSTLLTAFKNLGITRMSLQSTGGNQPLKEFLDPRNPEMAIWISHTSAPGYHMFERVSACLR